MDYYKQHNIVYEPKLIVDEIIDGILDKGADILYMKYVMAKLPQFLGELYSGVSDYIIDEVSLAYDRGDTTKDLNKFWNCDEEPQAAKIDTWARFRMVTNIKEEKTKILEENKDAFAQGSPKKDQKTSNAKSKQLRQSTNQGQSKRPQTAIGKSSMIGKDGESFSKVGKSKVNALQKSLEEYEKLDDLGNFFSHNKQNLMLKLFRCRRTQEKKL